MKKRVMMQNDSSSDNASGDNGTGDNNGGSERDSPRSSRRNGGQTGRSGDTNGDYTSTTDGDGISDAEFGDIVDKLSPRTSSTDEGTATSGDSRDARRERTRERIRARREGRSTRTRTRTAAQETETGIGGDDTGQPHKVRQRDLEHGSPIKGAKLRDVISATFMLGCNAVGNIPALSHLRIAQQEANMLGEVWANYIDSIPQRKRTAVIKVIGSVAPITIALGGTASVFLPRVMYPQMYRMRMVQQQQQQRPQQVPPQQPTQNTETQPVPPKGMASGMTAEGYDATVQSADVDDEELFDAFL